VEVARGSLMWQPSDLGREGGGIMTTRNVARHSSRRSRRAFSSDPSFHRRALTFAKCDHSRTSAMTCHGTREFSPRAPRALYDGQ
jgi:hypothetical protein